MFEPFYKAPAKASGGLVLTDQCAELTVAPGDLDFKYTEYDAIFIRAGRVMQANGEESNWLIPAGTLQDAVQLFQAVPVHLDHPELFGFGWHQDPKVANLIGITDGARWSPEEEGIVGKVRLYDAQEGMPAVALAKALFDQILNDRKNGRPVPSTGLSAVFYHQAVLDEESGLRITQAINHVESVDVVYSPGAGGYIRAALSAIRSEWPPALPQGEPLSAARPWNIPSEVSGDWQGTVPGLSGGAMFASKEVPMSANNPSGPAVADPGRSSGAPPAEAQPVGPAESGTQGQDKLAQVIARIDELQARLIPPAPVEPEESVASQLDYLAAAVERLTQATAHQIEPSVVQGHGRPIVSDRDMATPMDQMQQAWDWVFGVAGSKLPPPELRNTAALYRLITGDWEWTGRFNERAALAAANATTLADLAVNAMNKVIVEKYNRLAAYRWFEAIVALQPNDGTLHDMAWIQFGGFGNLPVVAEGAAYTELTPADTKETSAFYKYGGYVGVTIEMIRKSNIGLMRAIPRELTVAAVQTRSAAISSIFTTAAGLGPTLTQDATALFDAGHGNLAATAYSWTAWKAARLECYKQTELGSSKRQGLWPRFWLGPADLYDQALIDFGYGAGPGGRPGTGDNDVNPYAETRPGDPRPIPIAVPEWTDTADWAYLADPELAPIIQMSYADEPSGLIHPAPLLLTVLSPTAGLVFSNDTMPIKVKDHWAYGVATYRGIGKRNIS
jgi:hypothetical protein